MEQNELSVERVLAAVLRRKGAFLASFVAGAVVLGGAAAKIPPRYKAAVVLTVEPGRFPNDFLRPNVIPGLETRLGSMEKMLQSAPVIEELRAKTGLAAKDGARSSLMDALGLWSDPIDSWRKAFEFQILPGEAPTAKRVDEAVVVEMSFKHSDPELAAKVVNACAARANQENTQFRRAFVEEVVRFIQKEQERVQSIVHERDDAWNAFKLSNADRLPEQEALIVSRLGQLRVRYADLKQSERFSDARLEQLTAERGLLVAQIALSVQVSGASADDTTQPVELRRERLRLILERDSRADELRSLQAMFTDKTPQVVIAKDKLDATEARLREVESNLIRIGVPIGETAIAKPEHPDVLDFNGKDAGTLPSGLPKVPVKIPGEGAPKLDPDAKGDKGKDAKTPDKAPAKDSKDAKEAKDSKDASRELAKDAKPSEGPSTFTPSASANHVVQVLSNTPLDEKALEKQLDTFAYRLVVENPSYARIRGIDFALKETKESTKVVAQQREDSFAEIRKAEEQLAAIPEVRQRLESLGRSLIEARDDFARLTNQLDNAKKALAVENEGKGEQLRVIDFARPPSKPTGPGAIIFIGVALALALGVAAAAAYVVDARKLKEPAAPLATAAPTRPAPPARTPSTRTPATKPAPPRTTPPQSPEPPKA